MRVIRESWALFNPNTGKIAGDGFDLLDYFDSREDAENELSAKDTLGESVLNHLLTINRCDHLHVGKIQVVEVED